MAFPETILPIKVELDLAGTWTDITSDVYERDAIRITRGRSAQGQQVDAGTCQFTLNNNEGKYWPRNPRSPYYGLIGLNTPVRVSAEGGDPALAMTGGASDSATTPDAAALDITGDMEVRVEISHDTWTFAQSVTLAAKYEATGDQRSWALWIRDDGDLIFTRSTSGTVGTLLTAVSSEPVPAPRTGRMALRMTFDVDNGSGSSVTTFYTGDSIDTTDWTQLGDAFTAGTTTATFSSTAPLAAGNSDATSGVFDGRVHKLRVQSGIGGSAVADVDFTAQTLGDTSFVDDAGLTWTVNGAASILNRKTRFYGEISEWPIRWDSGGHDVYVQVVASGILRRLGEGADPLQSALRRKIPTDSSLIAYWPMEDGSSATQFASPLTGVRPMTFTGLDPASLDTLPGSDALPTLASNSGATVVRFTGTVPEPSNEGEARVEFVYFHETAPTALQTYMRILTDGTVREWYLLMDDDGTRITGRDGDGTDVVTNTMTWSGTEPFGDWYRMKFTLLQNGANIDYELTWIDGTTEIASDSGSVAGTLGRITAVAAPPNGFATQLDGASIGHVAVFDSVTVATDFGEADQGYAGETAGDRITRLADEESITAAVFGTTSEQEQVGAQAPEAFLTLLREAGDADEGILYEHRTQLAVAYRDRNSLYNQDVALTLDYSGSDGLVVPLDPTDTVQDVRNDWTVQRTDGSSGRAVLEEGRLSVQAPPNGIGRYPESPTRNLYDDDQPEQHANWLLHLNTWDEGRYPTVTVLLQNATHMIEDATSVDIGDRLQITNPPDFLPPEDIDLMVQGYTEILHQKRWEIVYNCTPAGPWTVGVTNDAAARADTSGSELVSGVTSSATSMTVMTTSGARWIDSATYASDFPFDLKVGGERVTATAITGALSDAFGRTVASGWGTADVGGAWSTSGGSASDYAVGSGYGSHTQSTVNIQRRAVLTAPDADFDLYVDVTTSATATGASLNGGPIARSADGSNFYTARLEFTTANAIILTLRKRVAGTETQLVTYTAAITHAPGTFVRVRFQGTGTALKAKVWLASASEPGVWHVETTDSELTAAASTGVRSFATTGNTNVSPQVRFDNFALVNPQAFTVTRSVNGITKSHAAGAAIRLADPTYVAL